jgi:hypothetical protein
MRKETRGNAASTEFKMVQTLLEKGAATACMSATSYSESRKERIRGS